MVGSDVLGYPVNPFRRKWLEHYYRSIFGATDIGSPEFATFEDFLIYNQDRTYEEVKRILLSYAPSDISSELKSISEEEEKLESEKESFLTEELSKLDIGGLALDKMRRDKEEIERLKSEINELKKRPKRVKKEKPPTKLETFEKVHIAVPEHKGVPASFEFGKDYKRVQELIFRDGEENIKKAKELLAPGSGADLTDEDRKDLSSLLSDVESGFTPAKEHTISEIHKKKVTKIRKATDIEHKEEEERRDEKEGELEPFRVVQYETDKLNMTNAIRFLEQHRRHIPAILKEGIKAWLNKHPEVYKFPVNTRNVDTLSTAFARLVQNIEPKNLREQAAIEYIQVGAYELVSKGVEQAVFTSPYLDMRWEYYTNTLKTKLPDRTQFKHDVVEAIKNLPY